MTTRDPDQAPAIDQDVRLPNGHRAVWAVEPDGSTCAWLLAPPCCCRREPSVGRADREAAPHEQLGRLPDRFLARIEAATASRCSRPRKDGRPCRAVVSRPGDACHHHDRKRGAT